MKAVRMEETDGRKGEIKMKDCQRTGSPIFITFGAPVTASALLPQLRTPPLSSTTPTPVLSQLLSTPSRARGPPEWPPMFLRILSITKLVCGCVW